MHARGSPCCCSSGVPVLCRPHGLRLEERRPRQVAEGAGYEERDGHHAQHDDGRAVEHVGCAEVAGEAGARDQGEEGQPCG